MLRTFLSMILLVFSAFAFSQARLVLNNNAFITYDVTGGPAYVVIDNANANAIQTLGTGGNIVSEDENARVKWNVKNSTATHVVPFTNSSGTKIPLTVDITLAGSNDGDLVFATYLGSDWQNSAFMPSDVTHMNDVATNLDNSGWVIDRFWIIDPSQTSYAYTTKPGVDITFSFDLTDIDAGNIITPASHNFGAQRFNNSTNVWGDLLPIGVEVGNTVTGATVAGTDLYRSWTLVDISSPLPIELIDFTVQCNGHSAELRWTTASETNNESFTIEKGFDGLEFIELNTIPGAINSNSTLNYSFLDENASGLTYYRLMQTDIDGTITYSDVLSSNCEIGNGIEIVTAYEGSSEELHIVVSSSFGANFNLDILAMNGKSVISNPVTAINEGLTYLNLDKSDLSTGIYLIRLYNESDVLTRKIMLK